jgi:hypothetical protein
MAHKWFYQFLFFSVGKAPQYLQRNNECSAMLATAGMMPVAMLKQVGMRKGPIFRLCLGV